MAKLKTQKKTLTAPGAPMTEDEFRRMVKVAEKGPFQTIAQATELINNWKLKHEK